MDGSVVRSVIRWMATPEAMLTVVAVGYAIGTGLGWAQEQVKMWKWNRRFGGPNGGPK